MQGVSYLSSVNKDVGDSIDERVATCASTSLNISARRLAYEQVVRALSSMTTKNKPETGAIHVQTASNNPYDSKARWKAKSLWRTACHSQVRFRSFRQYTARLSWTLG